MNNMQDSVRVRPMTMVDVGQVHTIDRLSFALPWPARSYEYEVRDNTHSRCWVVEQTTGQAGSVAAMAVCWLVVDEMHIATIAVHPDYRGRGLSKLLMDEIMASARLEGMLSVTLEVRAGNLIAQALYSQYGFEEVGRRPRYYQDNHEDALIMTVYLPPAPAA